MLADADLAAVAALMGTHRATLLLALIGGRPRSATELAEDAGISKSLASAHLSRLLDGRLITVEQHGRHRYYRLASHHVAEVLEAMLTLAPARTARSLRESSRGAAIRHARTCYDHLAGRLGVAITDSLQHHRLLEAEQNSYHLTNPGQQRLQDFGIDISALRRRRRAFARPCLDWTEGRPHLAGALGAGIADRLLDLQWVRHAPGSRALHITDAGHLGLRDELGINLAPSKSEA